MAADHFWQGQLLSFPFMTRTYDVTVNDIDVGLGTAVACDNRLALWNKLLEQTSSGDVVSVTMSVHAILQLQAKLTDSQGIPFGGLNDLKNRKVLPFVLVSFDCIFPPKHLAICVKLFAQFLLGYG